MEKQEKLICLIKQKKYKEAFEIYEEIPILDLQSKNPLLTFDYFEFCRSPKKNPVFLRVLLNYISLINLLYDNIGIPLDFHNVLYNFCGKFCYETKEINKEIYTQFVLMVKSNISVFNNIFTKDKDTFKKTGYKLGTIDYDFKKKGEDVAGIGYSFQELGKSFINEEILGEKKAVELPNLLFYLDNNEKVKGLIGKIFFLPLNCKINLNKRELKYGYNEFDQVILIKEDCTIKKDNPYFKYIKYNPNNDDKYNSEDLSLAKNFVYFLEFKSNGNLIKNVEEDAKKNNLYTNLFNNNVMNNLQIPNLLQNLSLYVYNSSEQTGYKKIEKYTNNNNVKLLYLNPSCQIVPLMNLKTQVYDLKDELSEVKNKLNEMKTYNLLTGKSYEDFKNFATKKFEDYDKKFKEYEKKYKKKEEKSLGPVSEGNSNNNINEEVSLSTQNIIMEINNDNNDQIQLFEGLLNFPMNGNLKNKIDNSFKQIASSIKANSDIIKFNTIFTEYKEGMNEFLKEGDSLKILNDTAYKKDKKDKKENIKINNLKDDDYSLFFKMFEPYIGKNKSPPNYSLIKRFILNKIRKKDDDMKLIYKVLYLCFFGNKAEDKNNPEALYPYEKKELINGLKNIVKYTLYYDKLRKRKEYYMLLLFKELIKCNSDFIFEEIITFKDKGLFVMILIVIILINRENKFCFNIFNDFKKTNFFLNK